MNNLPLYVYIVFGLVFLLALWLFSRAIPGSRTPLLIIVVLALIQSALGLAGFYNNAEVLTMRFPLLVAPALVSGVLCFLTRGGRVFIDSLEIAQLTLFHVIRVGVEIVLLWLFMYQAVPRAMSFEGRNFDVLSGLTAPVVYYFGFVKSRLSARVMILWNIICILLLLNVVSSAFLSLPARYQAFGFEQPNIAVGFFPFLLLPSVLVPLVLFSHAATIRQLINFASSNGRDKRIVREDQASR